MLQTKFISSLEKCFIDQKPEQFRELKKIRMYKNEKAAVQFLAYIPDEAYVIDGSAEVPKGSVRPKCSIFSDSDNKLCDSIRHVYKVETDGDFAKYARLRNIENVANYIPVPLTDYAAKNLNDGYLRTTAGLYPDVLTELLYGNSLVVINQVLNSVWIDFSDSESLPVGEHSFSIRLCGSDGDCIAEEKIEIEVIDAELPPQETKVTQWLHADCLADYYEIEPLSDRHFEICENYIKTAAKNGINMILMPIFTPALDTAVGGERTTIQLVRITKTGNSYSFDFSLVDRWIDMCVRNGIKYLEIAHLFTQWGAYHAPKIEAIVDGEYKRIFGWDTDATGEEYKEFLICFLKEFTAHLSEKGYKDNVYFHISDEPNDEQLEQYKNSAAVVKEALKGWKIFDALSNVDYYKKGVCEIPVPISSNIEDFCKEDISERWVYYCCGPVVRTSNRLLAMHQARTRCIGIQMYKYGIEGFLHWGYNFFNSQYSVDTINPFLSSNAGNWVVGGDANSVYPGKNGVPLESLRLIAFRQGIDDIRLLKLCEKYYSKDYIIAEIEKVYGIISFDNCINDTQTMMAIRNLLDDLIIKAIS